MKRRWRAQLAVLAIIVPVVTGLAVDGQSKDFEYPKGRAGEIGRAYVEAFSSGDDSLATQFYNTYLSAPAMDERPLKDQLWRYHHLYDLLGVLIPQSVVENKPSSLILLVKSEAIDSYFHVGLELDSASPAKLSDVYIRPAPRPK
jgi:hypothetical protein